MGEAMIHEARALFDRRAVLVAELAVIDAQLAKARREYSDANGFRVTIRTEAFHNAIGA